MTRRLRPFPFPSITTNTMPDPAPLATAPHPDKEKPLPPPPALPFPTAELVSLYQQLPSRPPPADVQLDARTWEHVRDLLEQSMFSSKVAQESVWVVSLSLRSE